MSLFRRLFTSLILCGLLLGSLFLIRLQLSTGTHKLPPDLLPNIARFRSERVCSTRALVLINCHPSHSYRRQVIRETWAHPQVLQHLDISVAFGVGKATSSDLQRSLEWEAAIFGDIIQEHEVDIEGSRTSSKIVQLLKLARAACDPIPLFFLKVEDDVFVNTFLLDLLLQDLETFSSANALWCLDWQRTFDRPHNNATWWVPKSIFNNILHVHPTHCVSTVYLMTARTLDSILRQHNDQTGNTMLPEDVYVTGILSKKAKISLHLLGERISFESWNEQVLDAEEISFSYLAESVEEETEKIWSTIVSEKINLNLRRTYDIGL